MGIKPCQLAILRRRPEDPDLFNDYPDEYWAGSDAPSEWVTLRSNAMLLNKPDIERALRKNDLDILKMMIQSTGGLVKTQFDVIALMEKRSFGWVIRKRDEINGWVYYTSKHYTWHPDKAFASLYQEDMLRDPEFKARLPQSEGAQAQELFVE